MAARVVSGITGLAVLVAAMCGVAIGQDIPWGEDAPVPKLPAIFEGHAKGRLAAEEVARQDAYRKLIERIYGTAVDAKTDVYDLALESRKVDTALRNRLKGMKELGTKYYEDGRVEIAVKVTIREVVEIIKKTYKSVKKGDRIVEEKTLEEIERLNRDKSIIVVGRGALKKSKGLEKIRAMRAAEADCYARIAARVFGLELAAKTSVRDFVLERDAIKSKVAVALLNGVKFTKYTFLADGSCKAEGQLTIRQVVEVLTRTYRRYSKGSDVKIEQIENLEKQYQDLVIKETGHGTVREGNEIPRAQMRKTFEERKTIIRRVLKKGIVVTE